MLLLQLVLVGTIIRTVSLLGPDTCAIVTTDFTILHHLQIVLFSYSLVGEVFDVLGDKQNVAFDDLAKLHQLGLVTCL